MGFFVGKPEGKRTLGRPRRSWEILKLILNKMEWYGLDLSGSL
jgi:hypothetical protein